jgi:hypothetical protein
MKILPVGTELFHADRRTDMTKLIVTFRSSSKASKITKSALKERKKEGLNKTDGNLT